MISPPAMGTDTIGKEHHLFLDAVFHLSADAIALIVESLGFPYDVRDDETRIGPLTAMLGLDDDRTNPTPGVGRLIKAGCTDFPIALRIAAPRDAAQEKLDSLVKPTIR